MCSTRRKGSGFAIILAHPYAVGHPLATLWPPKTADGDNTVLWAKPINGT